MSEVKNEGLEVVAVYDGKYLLQLMYMDTDEELCRHSEAIAGYAVLRARIAELEAESAEWSPVMQRLGDENQQLRAELAAAKETIMRYETTAENCDLLRAELAAIKGQVPDIARFEKHAMKARECLSECDVVLLSSIRRLIAAPAPSAVLPAVPDGAVLAGRAELSLIRNALRLDCEQGRLVRGEILTALDNSMAKFDAMLAASPAAKGGDV